MCKSDGFDLICYFVKIEHSPMLDNISYMYVDILTLWLTFSIYFYSQGWSPSVFSLEMYFCFCRGAESVDWWLQTQLLFFLSSDCNVCPRDMLTIISQLSELCYSAMHLSAFPCSGSSIKIDYLAWESVIFTMASKAWRDVTPVTSHTIISKMDSLLNYRLHVNWDLNTDCNNVIRADTGWHDCSNV